MIRRSWTLTACCVLGTVLVAGAAEKSLFDLLPAGGDLYLAYNPSAPGFDQTALHDILNEPEMKVFLDHLWEAIKADRVRKGEKALPEDTLRELKGCKFVMGVYFPPVMQQGAPNIPQVRAVVIPPEENKLTLTGKLRAQLQKFNVAGQGAAGAQTRAVGQTLVTTVNAAFMGAPFLQLEAATTDNEMYFALASAGGTAIDPIITGDFEPISKSVVYTQLRSPAEKGDAVFEVFCSLEFLLNKAGQALPAEAKKFLTTAGADSIRAARLALVPNPPALSTIAAVSRAGEWRGWLLFANMFKPDYDPQALAMVPRDVSFFTAGRADWSRIYEAVDKNILSAEKVVPLVAPVLAEMPVNLREDVFASLDSTFAMLSLRPIGSNLVCAIKIKDPQKLRDSGGKLVDYLQGKINALNAEKGISLERKSQSYAGVELSYLVIRGYKANAAPACAIMGDRLVIALNPMDIKEYLQACSLGKTVAENAEFSKLIASVPAGYSAISYAEQKQALAGWLSLLGAFVVPQSFGDAKNQNSALDLATFPSSGALTKHMFGSIETVTVAKDKVVREIRSPLGVTVPPLNLSGVLPFFVMDRVRKFMVEQRYAPAEKPAGRAVGVPPMPKAPGPAPGKP